MSSSRTSDVHLTLPDSTNLNFVNVRWDDKSLENPFYWGLRLTYWLPRTDEWGIAVDLTHAKIHADLNATVSVNGNRPGGAINTQETLRNTFDELSMSHGYNLLTVNALHRWTPQPHLQPFVGIGGGIAYPHVEVQTGSSSTDEYQVGGWVANAMAGLYYDLGQNFAVFAEYRISYVDMRVDLNGGGDLQTSVWTNHFNIGVSYRFARNH